MSEELFLLIKEEIDYETKVINKIKVFYDFHKTL